MPSITIAHGLPFVDVILSANNQELLVTNVVLDTGSVASIFRADDVELIGIFVTPEDRIRMLSGIGGQEGVIEKKIDRITVGSLTVSPVIIQIGGVRYGYSINGILGIDFLLQTGATIDLQRLELR
jgi:hypothetical protein